MATLLVEAARCLSSSSIGDGGAWPRNVRSSWDLGAFVVFSKRLTLSILEYSPTSSSTTWPNSTCQERATMGPTSTATRSTFQASIFDKKDFNDPAVKCPSADGLVHDVTNPSEVRNCCYDSLTDLDQSQEAVQDVVVAYLNHLIDIGVAGFRVDKATFMWPKDLAAIQEKVKDRWSGGRPFYILHVQDLTQGSVTWDEYDDLGYVTEFHYRQLVAEAMADSFEIVYNITSQSAGATLAPSARALVFLDNHETQRRGQQVASATHPWLTFRDAGKYTLATAFMLAYDYGFVRIMSSYNFSDVNEGPPTQPDGSIKDAVINDDGACEGGWVCEHRWPTIATLVRFRTAVAGADVNHWYAPHGLVAFSRGSVGFFAMTVTMSYVTKVMTGLPPGTYCELVSSCLSTLTVDEEGYISHPAGRSQQPPVFAAFHKKLSDSHRSTTTVCSSVVIIHNNDSTTTSSGYRRTVILLHWITSPAQYVFFRGGVDANHRAGNNTKVDPCAIPIRDREEVVSQYFQKYNAWRLGDDFLDWYGAEQGQGTFLGNVAEGSPGIWTSNNPADPGYQPINTFGNHYWMLDIDMDCSKTLENGYFELKAYSGHWEPNIATHVCAGSYPPVPYTSTNHFRTLWISECVQTGGRVRS
ncbi:hypothetical protein C0Q70_05516 [Pomacea canaliculata]|uniref:alpha-amylase n=1 Tax=Pomacea canaliculata TaxID=400727 RepID=A0A2T7PLF1_POMCA|nr:hypothetical protein C0Q70_05516 [Pomacea canaliculata]